MEIKINLFKTLFRNAGIVALSFICERIRSGYYANAIKVFRQALAQGEKDSADRLKKALDAFTVSALYNGARKLEHMVKYTGLIVLDFDNLDPAAIPDLKRRAAEMKETIVAFVSPSGRGLKIICRPYVSWALTLANHDQLFADLYDLLLHGQKAYLDRPAIRKVMERNEAHRERCAEEEIFLANVIKPDEQHTGVWLTATEILNELNMRTTLNLNTYGVVKLGLLLKKLGYTQQRFRDCGWKWYVYLIPVEQVNGEKYQPAQ